MPRNHGLIPYIEYDPDDEGEDLGAELLDSDGGYNGLELTHIWFDEAHLIGDVGRDPFGGAIVND